MGYSTEIHCEITTDRVVSVADLEQIRKINWWCEEVRQNEREMLWLVSEKRVNPTKDMRKLLDVLQSGGYKITDMDMYWYGEDPDDSGHMELDDGGVHVYLIKRKFVFSEVLNYELSD